MIPNDKTFVFFFVSISIKKNKLFNALFIHNKDELLRKLKPVPNLNKISSYHC